MTILSIGGIEFDFIIDKVKPANYTYLLRRGEVNELICGITGEPLPLTMLNIVTKAVYAEGCDDSPELYITLTTGARYEPVSI